MRYVEVYYIGIYQLWRRKKLRYNKIYAIDLRNVEVKLIDTKREIFGTLRNTTLYQNLLLIELRYMEVLLYFFKKNFWQNFEGIVITAGNFIISSDSPGNGGCIFCNFSIRAISGIFGKFLTFYYNFIIF